MCPSTLERIVGHLREESGLAYLTVLVLVAVLAVTGTAYSRLASMHAKAGTAHVAAMQAGYLAEYGLGWGQHGLRNETGQAGWAGVTDMAVDKGLVTVTADYSPTAPDWSPLYQVELTSSATVEGLYTRTIRHRYLQQPELFDVAVYAHLTLDDNDPAENIPGVHAVGTLPEFPSVDWSYVQSLATVTVPSNQVWPINDDVKTGIYYIGGDLTISGSDISFTGALFVRGEVRIIGDGFTATATRGDLTFPLLIVAGKDVNVLAADATLDGNVMAVGDAGGGAVGDVNLQAGGIVVNGGVYAGDDVRIDDHDPTIWIEHVPETCLPANQIFYFTSDATWNVTAVTGSWFQPIN